MRAARLNGFDGPSSLELAEVAEPRPGPDEVLIAVRAVGLNRADLLQCLGLYPAPPGVPADVPGLEFAGEVLELGAAVTEVRVGDRVMGLVAGGAYAERLVTPATELLRIPAGLDFSSAAAIPEAFATAFDALVLQGGLAAGQSALIHAAGSGVGTAAVQLVGALGAVAIGTSRTESKLERAKGLGLAHGVLLQDGWVDQVRALSGGAGVNVVLDLVGGEHFAGTLEACAPRATVMVVGLTAGPSAEIPLRAVLSKRLRIIGTTLRSRGPVERRALTAALTERVLPLFASGALRPVVSARASFEDIAAALQGLARNDTFGKVVATLG
ncbi:MAG: NAD(P)H-quinone oxidoreductase [Myxococcaceae bacterium]|nr:NAD(P)H-quinone oxidoreductase [Myxococcaceae bacterium]